MKRATLFALAVTFAWLVGGTVLAQKYDKNTPKWARRSRTQRCL